MDPLNLFSTQNSQTPRIWLVFSRKMKVADRISQMQHFEVDFTPPFYTTDHR